MNLNRYEKIDGEKLLEVLETGDSIFSEGEQNSVDEYKVIDGILHSKLDAQVEFLRDNSGILWFLQQDWYIKKPFDVRKAMIERPNEWVGAYNDERGKWIQVGFDTVNMRPVKAYHGYTGGVKGANGDFPTGYELETCIPIEDVPEEATR